MGVTVAFVTFVLDPALPVLLRPDGAVQVGWDPRRAVLVRPPSGLHHRLHRGRGPALRCRRGRGSHQQHPEENLAGLPPALLAFPAAVANELRDNFLVLSLTVCYPDKHVFGSPNGPLNCRNG